MGRLSPAAAPSQQVVGAGFMLYPLPDLGVLRIQCSHQSTRKTIEAALSADLPAPGQLKRGPDFTLSCLAPGEWLLTGAGDKVANALTRLNEGLAGSFALAVDLTHESAAYIIEGPAARIRLAASCPLDLGDGAFPAGSVTRSLLGTLGLFIARPEEAPLFCLIVDQTMATHALQLLTFGDCASAESRNMNPAAAAPDLPAKL